VFGAPFRNGECPDEALVEALARCFTELYAPDDTKSVALPKFELYMQLLVAMCETFVASSMPPSGVCFTVAMARSRLCACLAQ
jgi:hypothetical protein